jgi:hypothetical protein
MKHNASMGLLDRIFGNAKEREAGSALPPSSHFYESGPHDDDSEPSRNAPRRELVQVILRDTMRKHGIPSDWIDCRILSTVNRHGRPGLHVNFVVRQAHDRLLAYVFAFQDSFERELARFEPRSRDWLLSLGWEFQGFDIQSMADPKTWAQSNFSPSNPAPLTSLAPAGEEAPRAEDDVESDLQKLFAIRDAALAAAARKPAEPDEDDDHPEFQPTQPFDDGGTPKR